MLHLFRKDISGYTDQELLTAYLRKKEQYFLAELFTRYTHMVYGVCVKYLKSTDDASDAVMTIYEKLEKDLHRHKIVRFSTWLYVITKNHCLGELRSRQSQTRKHERWQIDQVVFMESEDFLHPLDDDEKELQHDQLKKCIEQLKIEQRNCIELFYFNNKCYLEIAEKLNMKEKSVKSHLQNGKRNLKICLEENHE